MITSTVARRSLAAGAALALALGLGGCSTIQSIFDSGSNDSKPQVTRDEETGEVAEEGTGSAFELEVGDCLNMPTEDEFSDVTLVPCGDAHDAEVYLNFNVVMAEYDEDVLYADAEATCGAEFQEYVGSDPATSKFYFNYFTPLEGGWNDGDDVVNCIAYQFDEATDGLIQTIGSVKGIAE